MPASATVGTCGSAWSRRLEVTASTAAVVDDHLRAELGAKPLRHAARHDVGGAAGREGHDHADRLIGPGGESGRSRHREAGRQQRAADCPACRHGSWQLKFAASLMSPDPL
jgi:hypothetical protein